MRSENGPQIHVSVADSGMRWVLCPAGFTHAGGYGVPGVRLMQERKSI